VSERVRERVRIVKGANVKNGGRVTVIVKVIYLTMLPLTVLTWGEIDMVEYFCSKFVLSFLFEKFTLSMSI
jgi:hypothetical protein